jgi:hypothetical protein
VWQTHRSIQSLWVDFGYPNSNMDRCPNIISDPYNRYLRFWISKSEYGQVHWHTHWPTWSLLVILDIQIRIWKGVPTYSLTNVIGTYNFGYPNSNMDRCPNILTDPYNCYLQFWISKFEYGQVSQHNHWPIRSLFTILDIQIRISTDVMTYSLTNVIISYDFGYPNSNMGCCKEKIKKIHILISKFKNGQQWQSKHMTMEKCVMTGRQNGYPNPKLTTTKKNSFGFGYD